MKTNFFKLMTAVLVIALLMGLTPVSLAEEPDSVSGSGGKTGSWSQINQPVERAKNWRQIVEDGGFQLGEVYTLAGTLAPGGVVNEYAAEALVSLGTYPSIDGSTVAVPMAVEFARQHLGLSDDEAREFVNFNTTHNAYVNLIEQNMSAPWPAIVNIENPANGKEVTAEVISRPPDVIIVTEPSEEELTLAASNETELLVKPVCRDAFVFVVNGGNPVDSLSLDQIRDIFSGKIKNWSEVGGPDMPIDAIEREPNSGSQTAMDNMVMQGLPMAEDNWREDSMSDLVMMVSDSLGSLGYTYQYYINDLYNVSGDASLKVLKIDGVAPEPQNIIDGSYPLSSYYYGVINYWQLWGTGGKFLNWMLLPEGQAAIEQAGYIPVSPSSGEVPVETIPEDMVDEDGLVFPGSDWSYLDESNLTELLTRGGEPAMLLGYARNEIFARHCNEFESPMYVQHYRKYPWYNLTAHHKVSERELNEYELANLELIKEWEQEYK